MALNTPQTGSQFIRSNQFLVTTTPRIIVPRSSTRRGVLLVMVGTGSAVYFGNKDVTAGTGGYLPANDGAAASVPTQAEIWACTASSTQTISVVDLYD